MEMAVTWLARALWAPVIEVAEVVVEEVKKVGEGLEALLWKAIARDRAVQVRVMELLEECRRETGAG